MGDVTEDALVDHALHCLVELGVAPLEPDLQDLLRTLLHQTSELGDFGSFEHQALLAENVFTREQGVFRHLEVEEEGTAIRTASQIVAAEQFTVVAELCRVAADGLAERSMCSWLMSLRATQRP